MRTPLSRLLLVLALVIGAAGAHAAPLAAYGKLPSIEAAGISPDGKLVAYVVTDGEKRAVFVRDLASGQYAFRGGTGEAKVRRILWAGNDHVIVMATTTAVPIDVIARRGEYGLAVSINVRTGKSTGLMKGAGNQAMNVVVGAPEVRVVNGETVAFVPGISFVGGIGRRTLFRVNLDKGSSRVALIGNSDTRDWVLGPDGAPIAEELYDGRSGRWTLRVKAGSGMRDAYSTVAPTDPPNMLGLGRDGRTIFYETRDQRGLMWREARLDDSAPPEPTPVRTGQAPIFDPQTGRLIGFASISADRLAYSFFDPEDERMWRAVTDAFPGAIVSLTSASADHRKVVVEVDSPAQGPGYAIVDLAARTANWIGPQYEGLKPDDIAPRELVQFKAADGLELTAYLTLPKGRTAKNLPLVVFPHGGPASRDTPGFDWWAQAMASRGYAVLQVQFRGSAGFGQRLLEAGYGQWGRRMQTDLSDGVRYLAGQGTIDPKRVCIVGASYGGYAALAGAALDPGVYRCAVSVAGIADLNRFVGWAKDRNGTSAFRYWNRFIGSEANRDTVLAEVSPVAHLDRVAIPILLIHGRDDTVVPLEQSQLMADAMKKAGKPVELVVQSGADHWLSRGDTRLQTLEATVTFLEKHNPPLPSP